MSAIFPLGKIALGAKGKTQKELLSALGYSLDDLKPKMVKLIKSMKNLSGVTLEVVSKIYVSRSSKIDPVFLENSEDVFNSSLEKVNFGNRQKLVDEINDFVAQQTKNKIQNLLTPQDISSDSMLLLVNAIYFQGNWRKHFAKAVPSTFYAPGGSQTVPMMHVIDRFKYVKAESLSAEIIELPYVNTNASFIIVLPDQKSGLSMLLTTLKLAPDMLNDAMKRMKEMSVKVLLPRFKVTSKLDLKDVYRKIGVTRIFHQNHNDLDSILVGQQVYVSSAIQKAIIEVTETGTEAAAATGTIEGYSAKLTDVVFHANHPFLFFLIVNEQQAFAGVYSSPDQLDKNQ